LNREGAHRGAHHGAQLMGNYLGRFGAQWGAILIGGTATDGAPMKTDKARIESNASVLAILHPQSSILEFIGANRCLIGGQTRVALPDET